MNGAARQTIESSTHVAEERVYIIVIGTPAGTVRRRTVVAVGVSALGLAGAQLEMFLIYFL